MAQRHAPTMLSAVEMLARLVSFDTTSRNSNLPLIDFVRSRLDEYGVPYRLSFDPTGQKANLHAIMGPVQAGGIAFSGHVDTVSTDGQTWTGDPFKLRRRDGRLIARGACDMNTIPGRAAFEIEWRNIPATDPNQELSRFQTHVATNIEPPMRAIDPAAGFQYETLLDLAAVSMRPEHDLARAACDITGAKTGGKVSYCSEGSLFQPAGIDCMVCGPGHLAQVHRPDEWIAESQLVACEDFVRRIVNRMAV
jgi:acetylornithine deacetylase/succinyl-diaminopimelate desuccinylase-like protein